MANLDDILLSLSLLLATAVICGLALPTLPILRKTSSYRLEILWGTLAAIFLGMNLSQWELYAADLADVRIRPLVGSALFFASCFSLGAALVWAIDVVRARALVGSRARYINMIQDVEEKVSFLERKDGWLDLALGAHPALYIVWLLVFPAIGVPLAFLIIVRQVAEKRRQTLLLDLQYRLDTEYPLAPDPVLLRSYLDAVSKGPLFADQNPAFDLIRSRSTSLSLIDKDPQWAAVAADRVSRIPHARN